MLIAYEPRLYVKDFLLKNIIIYHLNPLILKLCHVLELAIVWLKENSIYCLSEWKLMN